MTIKILELFGVRVSNDPYLVLHERVEDLDEEDEAGGEDAERDDEQDEPCGQTYTQFDL